MNTNETLELVKQARQQSSDEIAKSFSQSGSATTGITAYDLEGPAKKLYPVRTLLRNMLPRIVGGAGIQANWKSYRGINTGNFFGGIGEAQRGAFLTQSSTDNFAAFRALGVENFVTDEADLAAKGFEDVKATAVLQGLQSLMENEERAILFGRTSGSLGTTPTPSLTASTSGGVLTTSTWSVICVALTPQGTMVSAPGTLANVVPTVSFTSADGSTITQSGGALKKSAAATVSVTGPTGSIAATVSAVAGAAAYAWYIGAGGSERLTAITVLNSVVLTAAEGATQLASALPSSDESTNALVFNGLISQALAAGSGAYIKALPTGVAGVGTPLTADGAGGIKEVNDALIAMYNSDKLSPTHMFVSSKTSLAMQSKIMTSGANGAFRFNFNVDQKGMAGSAFVDSYNNPLGASTGVPVIKIVVHPFMPDGMVLFYSDMLPYPLSGVSVPAVMKLRRDYYQIEWPLRTRRYEYGVYMDGVLQHYAPFSMGLIYNIAV